MTGPDPAEAYDGPYADDLAHLEAEQLDDETPLTTRSPYMPLRTLTAVTAAADAAGLEPYTSDNGRWTGFTCPVCRAHGHKAAATVSNEPGGFLLAECAGCRDDVEPGILATLAAAPSRAREHAGNGNGTGTGMLPPDPDQLAWRPLDVVTLGDTPRLPPELGGILYPRRRHILQGESETGKTWLAFAIAADEIKAGRGVVWADLDYMGAQDVLERLRQCGCSDQQIRSHFAYYQPDGALDTASLAALEQLIAERSARLVVIDAFTGLCALHGLNPEKSIDVEAAYRSIQPLCAAGAAVVILDHVVKNPDNRGRYGYGAERKLTGADVVIGFHLVEHYGRGRTGKARLTVHKDRPAQLERPVLGLFVLTSDPDTHAVTWSIQPDESITASGAFRPTGYMERVSRYLEAQNDAPATRKEIRENVGGKQAALVAALDRLLEEGNTVETAGTRGAKLVTLVTAFREEE